MGTELANASAIPPGKKGAAALKRVVLDAGTSGADRAVVRLISSHLLDSLSKDRKVETITGNAITGEDFWACLNGADRQRALMLYTMKYHVDYIISMGDSPFELKGIFNMALFYNNEPAHAEKMYFALAGYASASHYLPQGKCASQDPGNDEHSLLRVPRFPGNGALLSALRIEFDFAKAAGSTAQFVAALKEGLYNILEIG